MGTLHLVVNVQDFFLKTTCLLKKIDSSCGQTLSGHTWSTARKFSIMNLSSLHPYDKSCLDHTARLWSALLDNSSRWSDHEFYCSTLFAPARTSAKRRCTTGTTCSGTSCRGYDPGYPRQTTWAAPSGAAQPTRRSLAGHDSGRRLPQDI